MTRSSVPFYFVDVFASRPLTGNPLALVPEADELPDDQMRAIAREFNQSETTFLLHPTSPEAQWRLRSFTPAGVEVGGAGHNAMGAWLWLADEGQISGGDHVQQIGEDLLPLTVTMRADGTTQVAMTQQTSTVGQSIDHVGALARSLGLRREEIDDRFAVRAVSTGVSHLLVAVRSADAVDRVRPDSSALKQILHTSGGEGCYVFTTDPQVTEPLGAHAYARFFNPTVGIAEDPATGTAAGPLAASLAHAGCAEGGTEVFIEQGHALGRPSRLTVHLDGDEVRLAGSGLVVGEGRLTV